MCFCCVLRAQSSASDTSEERGASQSKRGVKTRASKRAKCSNESERERSRERERERSKPSFLLMGDANFCCSLCCGIRDKTNPSVHVSRAIGSREREEEKNRRGRYDEQQGHKEQQQ